MVEKRENLKMVILIDDDKKLAVVGDVLVFGIVLVLLTASSVVGLLVVGH